MDPDPIKVTLILLSHKDSEEEGVPQIKEEVSNNRTRFLPGPNLYSETDKIS